MRWAPIIVISMIGCYAPSIPSGGACTTACPGDQVCVAGTCREPGDIGPPIDGSPAVDTDGDGLFDDRDNCVAHANLDQHDEDTDGAGDVCDPCPHLPAAGAAAFTDTDGDGVGDACDPQPAIAKQQWVLFDPFTTKRAEWQSSNQATFANDRMAVRGFIKLNIATGELRVAVGGEYSELGPRPRQAVIERAEHADGTYYYAEVYEDTGAGSVKLTKFDGTSYLGLGGHSFGGPIPTGAFAWVIDESVSAQTMALAAQHAGVTYPRVQAPTTEPALAPTDSLVFGTKSMTATYDYVAVIRTSP